jgi:hypothetical protein
MCMRIQTGINLPAVTTIWNPVFTAAATALSRAAEADPPSANTPIDGRFVDWYCWTAQLIPEMIDEVVPDPESERILTATPEADVAVPPASAQSAYVYVPRDKFD